VDVKNESSQKSNKNNMRMETAQNKLGANSQAKPSEGQTLKCFEGVSFSQQGQQQHVQDHGKGGEA